MAPTNIHVEGGSKVLKCHIKSNFKNYGRMVVESLKRPSRRLEKESIKHRIGTVYRKCSNLMFFVKNYRF